MDSASTAAAPFVDPDLRPLLDRVAAFRAPDDVDDAVAMMRGMRGEAPSLVELYPETSWVVTQHQVARTSSGSVRLVMARPRATADVPVIVCAHGGGLVSGTAEHGLREVAHLRDAANPTAVVSVEYRLAPEVGFGDAVTDFVEALHRLVSDAGALGLDADRLAVVGQSSGGAIASAAMATAGVDVRGVLLNAPMLDDRSDSWSMRAFAGTGTWDLGWNRVGWAAARRRGPHTPAPADLVDLAALHRVYLDVGAADPLVDEVTAFATRLWQAGSDTELHVWPGGFHGFDLAVPDAEISRRAHDAQRRWLARTLGFPSA